MRLRTRVDVFGAALLSALGATQLIACGGSTGGSNGSALAGAGGTSANSGAANNGSGGPSNTSSGGPSNTSSGGTAQAGANNAASGESGVGGAVTAGNGSSSAGSLGNAGSLGSAGASTTLNRFPCVNPKDLGDGFVQCDGFKHHQTVKTCESHVPRPNPIQGDYACKLDTQCTDKPYGYCGSDDTGEGFICRYGCVTSADCATGQQCECDDPVGRCVRVNCVSDADCEPGFLCRNYPLGVGCGGGEYTCQTPADACGSNADCSAGQCGFDSTAHSFQCTTRFCAVGRPFLVEGAERLAPSTTRADWRESAELPNVVDLDAAQRTRLAQRWTQIALMEHASIAAFARFTLQLLSLGAPASLVESASAAMMDETKHAKRCFALASHYAQTTVGPAQLCVERSLDESSLEAIVINAIREGCVGETVAAIEAHEAAEHAQDPTLRALLLEISADETRHAELAYRFVHWALSLGGPELARAVQREFAALSAEQAPGPAPLSDADADLLQHGIVPDAMHQLIRSQAIAQVIVPCSRALLHSEFRAQSPSAVLVNAQRA